MSFLIPNIFVLLIFNVIFVTVMASAAVISIRIIRQWDIDSTSEAQYNLERKNRLVTVFMKYVAILKIPLFFLFIYASGKMAAVLPGAMCAAGTVNATRYGQFLVYCSVLNIYILSLWLIINFYDARSEQMPYVKAKAWLTVTAFVTLSAELILFILNFTLVDPALPVKCCNAIFDGNNAILPSQWVSAAMLVITYSAMLYAYKFRKLRLYTMINFIYIFVAIVALIQFTGIYIYEVPTHRCPFCLLDDAYEQVGYFFYAFIYLGTATGIGACVMRTLSHEPKKYLMRASMFFNTLYFLLSVYYPIRYFILNRTWL